MKEVLLPLSFEQIYDSYSSILYGIVLKFTSSESKAYEILISTFKKNYKQYAFKKATFSLCVTLIKRAIKTANEQLRLHLPKGKDGVFIFENIPVLYNTVCKNVDVDTYCKENNTTRTEVAKRISAEIYSLHSLGKLSMLYPDFGYKSLMIISPANGTVLVK